MTVVPAGAPSPAEVLGKAGTENFPVASRLFPRALRPHLMNVYGFARLADDLGDEAAGDRPALLDWLSGEVDAIYAGHAPSHPLMRRLAVTVGRFDLPRGPFDRLIEANRQDQLIHRYATYRDLLDYCSLSANPVGELVLRLVRAATPERIEMSDATCTGLQLVEFWQDLGEDASRGRIYVPLEDMERFGYGPEDLLGGRRGDAFVRLMRFQAERTRNLLERGRPLAGTLPGRVGLAVRLFTAGGLAGLRDLERRDYDTLSASAHASKGRRALATAGELIR